MGGHGIKLFKYVTAGNVGKWESASAAARPSFYDELEDTSSSGKKSDWFLEVRLVICCRLFASFSHRWSSFHDPG